MTPADAVQWLAFLTVAVVLFILGMQAQKWWTPEPKPGRPMVIDTTVVDRILPQKQPAQFPEAVTLFQTVRDTVRECVSIPDDFQVGGVITPDPITVDERWFFPDRVELTYFDVERSRYVRETFDYVRPRWEVWADAGVSVYRPLGRLEAGGGLPTLGRADLLFHLRRDRVSVQVGVGTLGESVMGTVGIRARLFQHSF
jgi:hypothetical protein